MSSISMEGRVALVTGGGGGIGSATAMAFARAGASVVVVDIAVTAGEQTAATIRDAGGEALFVHADVTRADEVAMTVAASVERYGKLDYAFNNAGIEEEHAKLAEGDEALFDRMMGINVKGVWLCMRAQIRQMLRQGGGAIVNTASVAGLVGAPKHAIYGASKHAVLGLTRSAAAEYARAGIRINAVCPGVIRTAMFERVLSQGLADEQSIRRLHPIGRIGEVDEVAAAVLWLCSDQASFVVGHALTVDGGMTAI